MLPDITGCTRPDDLTFSKMAFINKVTQKLYIYNAMIVPG